MCAHPAHMLGEAVATMLDRLHATVYPSLTREQFERRMGIESRDSAAPRRSVTDA